MGTYMSAYVEFDDASSSPPFSDPAQVRSLTAGSFGFGKDYEVFDALAGGRDSAMAIEDRDPSLCATVSPSGHAFAVQSGGWVGLLPSHCRPAPFAESPLLAGLAMRLNEGCPGVAGTQGVSRDRVFPMVQL